MFANFGISLECIPVPKMLGTCRGIEERPAEPDLFDMLDKAWKTWQNVHDDVILVISVTEKVRLLFIRCYHVESFCFENLVPI